MYEEERFSWILAIEPNGFLESIMPDMINLFTVQAKIFPCLRVEITLDEKEKGSFWDKVFKRRKRDRFLYQLHYVTL